MAFRTNLKFGILTSIVAATLLFGACGGDDDGGGGGSDEEFVADICKAGVEFANSIAAIDVDLNDVKATAKAMAGPFEDFAKAIEDTNAPSDLKDWQGDMVDALDNIVDKLKSGDEQDIQDALSGDPFPEPPASAGDRFEAIAADNKDCQDADFAFGSD